MKRLLLKYIDLVKFFFKLLICNKKKIFLMDPPPHPNLGDQAQLMCTYKWLAENYPEYKVFDLPILRNTLNFGRYSYMLLYSVYAILSQVILKIFVRRADIFSVIAVISLWTIMMVGNFSKKCWTCFQKI